MGDIVRKQKNGKFLGWYVRYIDSDGRRKQRASHQPTKALARRFLVEIEARVARGQCGLAEAAPPPRELSVAELCELYVTGYSRPRIKNLSQYRTEQRSALRRILPQLGARLCSAVAAGDIRRLRDSLAASYKPNTVMSTLRPLSTAYSWARREGLISCPNPCLGVERPPRESLLEFLNRDDLRRLLAAAEERARTGQRLDDWLLLCAIATTVRTGLRKGELFGLRWQDLDLTTRRLDVARSYLTTPKSGHARHLRIPTQLCPLLKKWRELCPATAEGLVFPVAGRGGPRLGRKVDMLGLPELLSELGLCALRRPWHALRHTFASHFVMSGGNILTLQKILGHADIKMTLLYAHLAPDFLAEEMDRLAI
ncbi:MAG TPA: tyrosine-type recombinase/integrase [Pseudomonadota bacterium]|nr:tyrosine-type recombinase/integrase [Pseudomonadota bacterium]